MMLHYASFVGATDTASAKGPAGMAVVVADGLSAHPASKSPGA